MKLLTAFFRLIRWPNLIFIVITQLLFYFCVYTSLLKDKPEQQVSLLFFLLIFSSICIAAAGYIINDYFDIQIDAINKPNRLIINKFIKRRWAIVWHWILSALGVLVSIYISYKIKVWPIAIINLLCVFVLWFYSTTFKKKLLIGNLMIAALTAWVILVVYLFAGADLFSLKGFSGNGDFNVRRFFKFTLLYACFAFITTLIREVIKDLEDMEGDRKYDCNTMPIAWGVPVTKVFVGVWIVVTIAALAIVQLYAWQSGWWLVALYFLFFQILPAIFLIKKLTKATVSTDYHALSNIIKLIMLFGILSMLLLKFIS
jgi:4-hydroxybenzoate polyprenyltransferase